MAERRADPTPRRGARRAAPKELLDQILDELLQRQSELSQTINYELNELLTPEKQKHHLSDLDEPGSEGGDEELNYKLVEIESAELAQVEWAIERLREGTYGTCEECERAIDPDRLKALVFATTCIDCKRAIERAEPQDEILGWGVDPGKL